jgi:hypothetical protein
MDLCIPGCMVSGPTIYGSWPAVRLVDVTPGVLLIAVRGL